MDTADLAASICPYCRQQSRPPTRFCDACGAALDPDTSWLALPEGTRLGPAGRYRVEKRLGRGGFGEVYRALDTRLNRLCVVKRLHDNGKLTPDALRRRRAAFLREAQLLTTLNHPGHEHIPEIYDVLPDVVCLVMKYIEGISLQARLDRSPSGLPEPVALRYARDVCAALAYMHAHVPPVLHRDIKPDNIMVDRRDRPWLIDFGLTQLFADDRDARQELVAGTMGYAPPEQLEDAAEPRSDIFALGTTLYVLLTNPQRPFVATTATMPDPAATRPLPPLRTVNAQLRVEVEALIERCRAPLPADRPDAEELLAELSALFQSPAVPEPPLPEPVPDLATFVGRTDELARADEVLGRNGVVALVGMAGVGKTALAAQLVQRYRGRRPICWHACRPTDGRASALLWSLAGFLAHIGHPDLWRWLNLTTQPGTRPPRDIFMRALGEQLRAVQAVVCLDDVDLLAGDLDAEALLLMLVAAAHSGGVSLVLTGRTTPTWLGLAAEDALGGLDLAAAQQLMAEAAPTLAEALFVPLYAATGGSPQFLLLAAAAIRSGANPEPLIDQLPQTTELSHYLLETVDRQLGDDERALLHALAILDEPASLDAVEATLDRSSVWPLLQRLLGRHLLFSNGRGSQQCYWLHGVLAGYFEQQLSRRTRLALHRRAAAFYEHEERDLMRAITHALMAGEGVYAAMLATTNLWELINAGHAQRLARLLPQLQAERLDLVLQVQLLQAQGELADLLGDEVTAQASYDQALRLLAAVPDTATRALYRAQLYRATATLLRTRAPLEAVHRIDEGLAACAHPEIPRGEARLEQGRLYQQLGSIYLVQGKEPEALAALDQARALLPQSALRWQAHVRTSLGVAYCALGEVARGLACYREAEAIYQQLKDDWGLAMIRHNQAIELDYTGDWAAAERAYMEALEIARHLGDVNRQSIVALGVGTLWAQRGDHAAALRYLEESIRLATLHQMREYIVAAHASLVEVAVRAGAIDRAEAALAIATQVAAELGSDDQVAELARCQAQIALARGARDGALDAARRAVAAAQKAEDGFELGLGLRVLAQALLAAGAPDAAIAHLSESIEALADRPYEAMRSRLILGLAYNAHGQPHIGKPLLETARDAFAALGAAFDRAEAEALLCA